MRELPARALASLVMAATAVGQSWVSLAPAQPVGGNAAWDSSRERVVVLGDDGKLWEFPGSLALRRAPASPLQPVNREHAALVYDRAREHLVLFGGLGVNSPLGDTWIWDGVRWQQPFSVLTPPPRHRAAMAYDRARQRVVLFGGHDGTPLTDTWEHDGSQWRRALAQNVPPAMGTTRMVFDTTRGLCTLAGTPVTGTTIELFDWNGVDWSQPSITGQAPLRNEWFAFAYDEARQRAVLFAGVVWEWDGAAWTAVTSGPEFQRSNPAAWFDPILGQVVMSGGEPTGQGTLELDARTWDGSTAQLLTPTRRPPGVQKASFLWHPPSGRAMRFGGIRGGGGVLDTTSTWDGTTWSRATPTNAPSARFSCAVASDYAAGRTFLFGGFNRSTTMADLWEWTGSDWTPLASATRPPSRHSAGLAWDEARSVLVLFGGMVPGNNPPPPATPTSPSPLADTWEWAPSSGWTNRTPAPASPSPAARAEHAMEYDPSRSRVVVFGGKLASGLAASDTWEWDGAGWQQMLTATSPPGASRPSMAFDRSRSRMVLGVLHERIAAGRLVSEQELWDYDGTDWTLIDRQLRDGIMALVYDDRRARILVNDGPAIREWSDSPASTFVYGNGCGSRPPLAARTSPRIGEPEFGLEARTQPNAPVVFALSTTMATTPISGTCNLEIGAALATSLQVGNANGFAWHLTPIPSSTALRGLALFCQAGTIDPHSGALGLSAGLRITVGD